MFEFEDTCVAVSFRKGFEGAVVAAAVLVEVEGTREE